VAVDLETVMDRAPLVLPDLRNATKEAPFSVVDALAALAPDGALWVSIVHRGTSSPIRLRIVLKDFNPARLAEVRTLSADVPWAANTLERPDAIKPVDSTVAARDGEFDLELKPYSVLRVRIPRG
jgi:alpha-L-arabinofuranosidase